VFSDPEVLPCPGALGRAVRQVLRTALDEPARSVAATLEAVRRDWA